MDLKFSKVTRKGPITIITLSRPEVYNALHIDAHFELNKVFDDFSADPDQWVAIVTGAGDKAFCAGNDLKWQAAGGKRGWDKGGFAGRNHLIHKTEFEAFLGRDVARGEDHAHGALEPDLAGQPVHAAGQCCEADAGLG